MVNDWCFAMPIVIKTIKRKNNIMIEWAGILCCVIGILGMVGNTVMWVVVFRSKFYAKSNGHEIQVGERLEKIESNEVKQTKEMDKIEKDIHEIKEIIKKGKGAKDS